MINWWPGAAALTGVGLAPVENVPTRKLVPHEPGVVSGWWSEPYYIDLIAVAKPSQQRMNSKLERMGPPRLPVIPPIPQGEPE